MMVDTLTDDQLVIQILDQLKDGQVSQEAVQSLAARIDNSPDARDYFMALAGDPRLLPMFQEALNNRMGSLESQRDTLKRDIEMQKASLSEAQSLLTEMQRIPTIVSRDLLKQMVLLVMIQHNTKEAL